MRGVENSVDSSSERVGYGRLSGTWCSTTSEELAVTDKELTYPEMPTKSRLLFSSLVGQSWEGQSAHSLLIPVGELVG
jgi:hypothetical protein